MVTKIFMLQKQIYTYLMMLPSTPEVLLLWYKHQDFHVQRNKSEGYDKIELNLYEKVRRKVMFYGMEITRVERPADGE